MPPSTRSTNTSSNPSSSTPSTAPSHTHSTPLPANAKPISVLFVCLGNICRSPLAEATFQHLTSYSTSSQHPLISRIDSCGTGAYHIGAAPDGRTLDVLAKNGIPVAAGKGGGSEGYKHKARKVRVPQDFEAFDYVIAMDSMNLLDLQEMKRKARSKGLLGGEGGGRKVFLYGEFGGRDKDEEVDDPYYGGRNGFEIAFEQVVRCGRGLLGRIEEEARKKGEERGGKE